MDAINRFGRPYRRFRYEKRYDNPILIFAIDTAISLAKVCLVVAVLLAAWIIGNRLTKPDTASTANTVTERVTEETTSKPNTATTESLVTETDAASRQNSDNSLLESTASSNDTFVASADNTALNSDESKPLETVSELSAATETPGEPGKSDTVNEANMVNENWVKALDPTHYIIQFGSSPDLSRFDEFLPIINQGEPIAIYPFRQTDSGRPMYGIATGVYDNADAALAAIENFSAQARAYGPWVRLVADVNKQIDEVTSK